MWSFLILLPLEILSSWGIYKFFNSKKIEDILITGQSQIVHLPVIDSQFKKLIYEPNRKQQFVVDQTINFIHYMSNTKILEYIIMSRVQKYWPGSKSLDSEVIIVI